MPSSLLLLPMPRVLTFTSGCNSLNNSKLILLAGPRPQEIRFPASRFQKALRQNLAFTWEQTASQATPGRLIGLVLRIDPKRVKHPQGYELSILPDGINITSHDEAGAFYAVGTLIQILEQSGSELPCLHITDWPDYPVRGVMLDISRDKVPSQQTLLGLIDLLASWKINQLQLYTEHTFAYRQHPEVWKMASPLTGEEILELDAYCRERWIELVPNQNSFGHLHRWLVHPTYAPLSEVSSGFKAPWGPVEGPFSLCPSDPGSFRLVSSLFDELLPHFSSRMVNVGCDETFDLGQGRSQEVCSQKGTGQVYLEFLLKIYSDLQGRGHTMQYWGDIILKHPELIPYLPKDAIALDWGYEADHPFDQETALFKASGIPFYVCPGTSSWSSIAGRSDNALGNLLNAAENGLKQGASGYLITDWGDNGHWQALPISFLGFAAGSAYAWSLEANRNLDIPEALNWHAFHDVARVTGQGLYQLGNLYKACEIRWPNSSVLNWILQESFETLREKEKIRLIPYPKILDILQRINLTLASAKIQGASYPLIQPDLIRRELELTIQLLRHACWRGILATQGAVSSRGILLPQDLDRDMQAIIDEYQEIWLERNRPGGLADSVTRFHQARTDYACDQSMSLAL